MTSLQQDIVRRIERLPKPINAAGALLPLFEAISNSIHSTQDKFKNDVTKNGQIIVEIHTNRKKDSVWATVEDNGDGLNERNWTAFTTTDTANKIKIGGKGVGRLLWLDCFEIIEISSVFSMDDKYKRRTFKFSLKNSDQIENHKIINEDKRKDSSFYVKFSGLRNNGYLDKFPGRDSYIFQHVTSHFLPTFIGKRCPQVKVIVGTETRQFPEYINDIVLRRAEEISIDKEEFGPLSITLMECDRVASADLKGLHFVHFIAHDRTVHSQCIDSKLGLRHFGEEGNKVFHSIVTGEFLDKNVNQERTAFTFENGILDKIINDVFSEEIEKFLTGPLERFPINLVHSLRR